MPHTVRLPKINNERYVVHKRLGGGGFCEVVMAMDSESMNLYALKVLDRNKPIFQKGKEEIIERKLRAFMRREAQVMRELDHPNIVKFFDIYEDDLECFIVLEIVSGGELYDRIVSKEKIPELEAKDIMKQLVEAVHYIHQKGFVHRDIKPENILIEKSSNPVTIKLADFGLSRPCQDKMFTNCGTVDYCAPELLLNRSERKGYGKEVDNWSIGVVMFVSLGGYQPFMAENRNEELLIAEIITGKYKFHRQYWQNISTLAKKFIASLLKVNPDKRASTESMLQHPWLGREDIGGTSRVTTSISIVSQ